MIARGIFIVYLVIIIGGLGSVGGCFIGAILVALIFRTLDALRIFDLPFVLTQGQNGTSTLSTIAQETFATNRIYGLGSAMAVLTFIVVMIVSFSYIRFVGGNIRGLAEE